MSLYIDGAPSTIGEVPTLLPPPSSNREAGLVLRGGGDQGELPTPWGEGANERIMGKEKLLRWYLLLAQIVVNHSQSKINLVTTLKYRH